MLESLKQTQKREINTIKDLQDAVSEQRSAADMRLSQLADSRSQKKKTIGVLSNISLKGIEINSIFSSVMSKKPSQNIKNGAPSIMSSSTLPNINNMQIT